MEYIEDRSTFNGHRDVYIQREVLKRMEGTRKTIKVSDVQFQDKEDRKYCLHLLRTIFFFGFLAILIYEAISGFQLYLKSPTYTKTRIEPQHHAEFPTLSICPTLKGYKHEILKVNRI